MPQILDQPVGPERRVVRDRHVCHAGCGDPCPSEHLMCGWCWALVPRGVQAQVYRTFRAGRRTGEHPTAAWHLAAGVAIAEARMSWPPELVRVRGSARDAHIRSAVLNLCAENHAQAATMVEHLRKSCRQVLADLMLRALSEGTDGKYGSAHPERAREAGAT